MIDRRGGVSAGTVRARQHYIPGNTTPRSRAWTSILLVTAGLLVGARLPSLAQPMGADQGLYAYVGERILRGERPYLDAWDQKPPAIHYTYALLRSVWPADGVVAAADLLAAAGVAVLLFAIGRALVSRHVGVASALLFLLLSNPAFGRLGGVRVRAQAETFIVLAVTAGIWLLLRSAVGAPRPAFARVTRTAIVNGAGAAGLAGLLFGLAFTYKYNAGIYAAAALGCLAASGAWSVRRITAFVLACSVPAFAALLIFADALQPLYDATIAYNVQYSGETYHGPMDFVAYLFTFPILHARVDALWTLGGAGCLVLLAGARLQPQRLIPVVWVAAGCVSIAVNSSRGLPQYFVQVAPALALAAAWGGAVVTAGAFRAFPRPRAVAVLALGLTLVAVATWRVNQFPKLVEQTVFDLRYMAGGIPRDVYLGRYVDGQKYTALGAAQVAGMMRAHSRPDDPVYLFGFTAAAYVHAERVSASRFFWSRPVIVGFNENQPGYGVQGLLAELERASPAVVALQIHDWAPDVADSARFFLSTPALADWLHTRYRPVTGPAGFDVWIRRE